VPRSLEDGYHPFLFTVGQHGGMLHEDSGETPEEGGFEVSERLG
jgi:hypothetical protein